MPPQTAAPSPLKELLDLLGEGCGAAILTGNTMDRLISSAAGIPRPMGVESAIYQTFGARGFVCAYLSFVEGLQVITPPGGAPPKSPFPVPKGAPHLDPAGFFAQIVPALLQKEQPVLLFVRATDLVIPDGDTAVLPPDSLRLLNAWIELASSDAFRASGNVLILSGVQAAPNAALRRSGAFRQVPVPLPPEAIREEFVSFLAKHPRFSKAIPKELPPGAVARLSNGLRLTDIEGLVRRCMATGATVTRESLVALKVDTLQSVSHGLLSVHVSDRTMDDVVGCQHLRHFANYQKQLAHAGSAAMPAMIALLGVPGSGKTYFASAYANHLGLPLIIWSNTRSKWVGESEQQTEMVLRLIRENSPCVVFVDECDQLLGGRSTNAGDGGVDARIFGSILSFTGDASLRGKIQFLLASNRADLLDAALLDRCGERIVFVTPPARDRALLVAHAAAQLGRKLDADVDLKVLAADNKLATSSARNLYEVVATAGRHADMAAKAVGAPIGKAHLERAVGEYVAGDPLEIEFIALNALSHLRFSSELPWLDADGHRLPEVEIPPYLVDVVDPVTGHVDGGKLAARLHQVESLRRAVRLSR